MKFCLKKLGNIRRWRWRYKIFISKIYSNLKKEWYISILTRILIVTVFYNFKIRVRLRGFFLNHSAKDERDYGFWTSAVLRTQETTELQAKLFMIVYGPIKMGESGRGRCSSWF